MGAAKVIQSNCIYDCVIPCFAHFRGVLALRRKEEPYPAHKVWGAPAHCSSCTCPPCSPSLSDLQPHWLLWAPRRGHAATCQRPSFFLHSLLRQPSLIARPAQCPLKPLLPITLQGSGLTWEGLLNECLSTPTWFWVPWEHRVGAVRIWILDERRSNCKGHERRLWLPPRRPRAWRPYRDLQGLTRSARLPQPRPSPLSVLPSPFRTLNSGLITCSWCSGSHCVPVTGQLCSSLSAFVPLRLLVPGILFPQTSTWLTPSLLAFRSLFIEHLPSDAFSDLPT